MYKSSAFLKPLIYFLLTFCNQHIHAQSLDSAIRKIQEKHELMGGILLTFDHKEIIKSVPFGLANYQEKILVNENTHFRIASISKTITALAIMKLYENQSIDLDADISSILGYSVRNPYFPDTRITIRMLLSHTSSIIDGKTYSKFIEDIHALKPIPNLSELLISNSTYYSESQYINQKPGTYFKYSNINYGILGTIVEKVSGMRFDLFCKKLLFDPLNISGGFNKNETPNPKNLATLYRKKEERWIVQADKFQEKIQKKDYSKYIPGTNGLLFSPQGGLRVSAHELAKLFQLFLNGGKYNGVRLLSKKTINLMITPRWIYSGKNGDDYSGLFKSWGLGVHVITNTKSGDFIFEKAKLIGHPGEAYGLISDAYVDIKNKKGFIFITNGCGKGYQTNKNSAFYTVEYDIFRVIESLTFFNNTKAKKITPTKN